MGRTKHGTRPRCCRLTAHGEEHALVGHARLLRVVHGNVGEHRVGQHAEHGDREAGEHRHGKELHHRWQRQQWCAQEEKEGEATDEKEHRGEHLRHAGVVMPQAKGSWRARRAQRVMCRLAGRAVAPRTSRFFPKRLVSLNTG